jgi:hypothetical protein
MDGTVSDLQGRDQPQAARRERLLHGFSLPPLDCTVPFGIKMFMAQQDWRLRNQEGYLQGVSLYRREYKPASDQNDHDHCEFCFAKFMQTDAPDVLHEGYCTQDRYRWICLTCFDDFHDKFAWKVAN